MIDYSLLLEKVAECKNAIVVGHSHPDGDCVGSAVALACLIEDLGGKAKVIFPEAVPERIKFLLGDRAELSELPSDLGGYQIVCVDTASANQHAAIKDALESRAVLRIDHHDIGIPYAKSEFVDPSASATGEIIFELYEEALRAKKIENVRDAARDAIYGAICSDTGCFKYQSVTPKTHRIAARLIEYGAPTALISRLLFDTKDAKLIRAEGIAQSKLCTFASGKIGGIAIEESDYTDGLTISDFETAIDIARSLRGVDCAVTSKATVTKGAFRVSLRSSDDTDVSAIAAVFGGGGHIRAAGCTVAAESATAALEKVVKEIEKAIL